MKVKAPDQEQVQRCKQQILWSAESQTSLADLECRVDESVDRAAAGKVTFCPGLSTKKLSLQFKMELLQLRMPKEAQMPFTIGRRACLVLLGTSGIHSSSVVAIHVMEASQTWATVAHCHSSLLRAPLVLCR